MTSIDIPEGLVGHVRDANHIVVLTGAGVSAESGIPTFRDAMDGLWAKYDPMELATPEAFNRDPELVTAWYDDRRVKCAACRPNPGHIALAALERELVNAGRRFDLITQNVDRLHHQAGSERVIEIHGTLWLWRCIECGKESEERQVPFESHPLYCDCGGLRRPGVVWFGENLPLKAIRDSDKALNACDLFISIGTSAVVYPAAGFIHTARSHGAATAEINLDPTPITGDVDWAVHGPSAKVLPRLIELAFGR